MVILFIICFLAFSLSKPYRFSTRRAKAFAFLYSRRRVYKPPQACHPERSEGCKSHCAFSSRINVNNTTLFIFLLSVGMTMYALCTKPLPDCHLIIQPHCGNGSEFPVTLSTRRATPFALLYPLATGL